MKIYVILLKKDARLRNIKKCERTANTYSKAFRLFRKKNVLAYYFAECWLDPY
jgi:hypothetical protein